MTSTVSSKISPLLRCVGRKINFRPVITNSRPHLSCAAMSTSTVSSAKLKNKPEFVTINFIDRDGDRIESKAKVGDHLLDVAINNDVDLEGACEGTLSCSTCHLIFSEKDYEALPDKPTDEEMDMLDLAYGLTDTSRLGCQVYVSKDMDGWTITVPEATADARDV